MARPQLINPIAGNALASLNARISGIEFDEFQILAGALHAAGPLGVLNSLVTGKIYGNSPYHGEIEEQYRMSVIGYTDYYQSYLNYLSNQ